MPPDVGVPEFRPWCRFPRERPSTNGAHGDPLHGRLGAAEWPADLHSGITLRDQVDAVVDVIDPLDHVVLAGGEITRVDRGGRAAP
jgi:hypothetical protein